MNSPWTTTHEQLSDDEKASSGVTEVSTEQGGGTPNVLVFWLINTLLLGSHPNLSWH